MPELSKTQKAALLAAHNNGGKLLFLGPYEGWGDEDAQKRRIDDPKTERMGFKFGSKTINVLADQGLLDKQGSIAWVSDKGSETIVKLLARAQKGAANG